MTTGPFESPDGQDHDPPDIDLALLVVIDLLADVTEALHKRRRDRDLLLRIGAVRRALIRLKAVRGGS